MSERTQNRISDERLAHLSSECEHDIDCCPMEFEVQRMARELTALRASHKRLVEALEGVQPYMEAAENAGLVGDEGCHWPVENVRVVLAEAAKLEGK